tara:strand:- start:315 stop:2291 length:1977 start_codon:yes stop_codon:yes gene_type:complete
MINFFPAQVKDIITSPRHELAKAIGSYSAVGTIRYEVVGESSANNILLAKPANPRITDLPVIDEYVLIFKTVSKTSNFISTNEDTYYLPMQVNVWGNQNHNSNPGEPEDFYDAMPPTQEYLEAAGGNPHNPSENFDEQLTIYQGEYFKEKKIKQLLPKEGDYIIEGRFGQSIRFGSTANQNTLMADERDNWSDGGMPGDPITIISNGLPNDPNIYKQNLIEDDDIEKPWIHTMEDVNNDPSSIYLTSNQRINNFRPAGVGHPSINAFKPEEKTETEEQTLGTNYITKTDLNNDPLPEVKEEDVVTTLPSETDLTQVKTDNSELANISGEEMTPFYIIEGSTDNNNIFINDNINELITNNPSTIPLEAVEGEELDTLGSWNTNIGSYFKLAHLIATPNSQNYNIYTSSYSNPNHPDADFVRKNTEVGFYIDVNNVGSKKIITKEYIGPTPGEESSYRILEDEPKINPIDSVEPYTYLKTDVELLREAESYIFGNYSNYGIDNYPGKDMHISYQSVITNLTKLFENCIDPIINDFGNIKIVSAYRSRNLNRTLPKNPSNSEHIFGHAVDIKTFGPGNNAGLFNFIYTNLEFKNLMWAYPEREEGSWIHLSFIEGKNYKKTTLLSENNSFHKQYNGTRRGPNNFYQDNITEALTPINFQNY